MNNNLTFYNNNNIPLDRLSFNDINNNSKINFNLNPKCHNVINTNELNDFNNLNSFGFQPKYDKPQFIHNNISNNSTIDILVEYTLVIDSIDRNIDKFPNPFKYNVYFNPLSQTTDAYIYREFNNVKYIKLETAILPRKYTFNKTLINLTQDIIDILSISRNENQIFNIDISNNNSPLPNDSYAIIQDVTINGMRYIKYAPETPYGQQITKVYETKLNLNVAETYVYELLTISLEDEKFLLLNIDEYNDVNEMSTNQNISKSFSILFPDFVNGDFFYTDTHYVDKIFKFSNLGNITKFSINITKYDGKLLTNTLNTSFIDYNVGKDKECICKPDNNGNYIRNYKCPCSYIRHPLYHKFQNTLLFKIGVIENDIDKGIFS